MKKLLVWTKNLFVGGWTEIQDRILMSPKRLIKFIGICLVPIIYGVICLVAFWNPVANIGKAPMAIMNNDYNVIMATKIADDGSAVEIGALYDMDSNELFGSAGESIGDLKIDIARIKADTNYSYKLNSLDENGQEVVIADNANVILKATSLWELVKGALNPKTDDNIADTDYTFSTDEIADGMALTNISYIEDKEEINDQWQNSKYYAQIKIDNGYVANLLSYVGTVLNGSADQAANIVGAMQPVQVWTTFERNYLFGYYMKTFAGFIDGMILKSIPSLLMNVVTSQVLDELTVSGAALNIASGETTWRNEEQYALLRSEGHTGITDMSLFGNLKADGTYDTTGAAGVGGKVYNAIKTFKTIWVVANALPDVASAIKEKLGVLYTTINNKITSLTTDDMNNLTSVLYKTVTGQLSEDEVSSYNSIASLAGMAGIKLPKFADAADMNTKVGFIKDANQINQGYSTELEFDTNLSDLMKLYPDVFANQTTLAGFVHVMLSKVLSASVTGGVGVDDLVTITIRGEENGLYGIGLGEFFLVIGVWVGILMQTFVYDRAKRKSKLTARQWYLSKTILMMVTAFIQVTAQIWVAYAAGWSMLGAETVAWLWLWMLLSAFVFVIIIQSVWFAVKDEAVGKFLVVIIMVLSLAAGGGTFPAFAQFKFFEVVSYIVPFTYVLRGMGAIVFGIPEIGTNAVTTTVVLQNMGYLLIFAVVFLALGLLVSARDRHREIIAGSFIGKHVIDALEALERDTTTLVKVNAKGKKKFNWKEFGNVQDLELYRKVREIHPEDVPFKWWSKKDHDPVAKPNETDEDVISRNE